MKFRYLLLLTLAITLLSSESGNSFVLNPWKWPNATFNWLINPANADVGVSPTITGLKNGNNVWRNWCPGVYKGKTTIKTVSYNQKNVVFFRKGKNTQNPNAIAICYTYFTSDQKTILDSDIVFYDGWKFFGGGTGCSNGFYIFDIMAHEAGHRIGIAHSTVLAATMYATTPFCSKKSRTLADDDKKAAAKKYL